MKRHIVLYTFAVVATIVMMAGYETDWLRAKVYCQSLEGTRLDSAIAICERLKQLAK